MVFAGTFLEVFVDIGCDRLTLVAKNDRFCVRHIHFIANCALELSDSLAVSAYIQGNCFLGWKSHVEPKCFGLLWILGKLLINGGNDTWFTSRG